MLSTCTQYTTGAASSAILQRLPINRLSLSDLAGSVFRCPLHRCANAVGHAKGSAFSNLRKPQKEVFRTQRMLCWCSTESVKHEVLEMSVDLLLFQTMSNGSLDGPIKRSVKTSQSRTKKFQRRRRTLKRERKRRSRPGRARMQRET